ncbi:MAG: hypothetical protein QOF02_641 [Blastocatellia bacterium]|jgi:hypothetical protein|nr:hypothetical protein [Blastocatellia bacterium]
MTSRKLTGSLLCLLLLCGASAIGARAQEGKKQQLVIPMKGGYFVAFTTEADPSNARALSSSFAEAYFKSQTIRRVFVDSGSDFFFGYDLVIEPVADAKQFRVLVKPLSAEDEKELRARTSFKTRRMHPDYNVAGLSRAAAPQLIQDGDAFALDVLVNPQTGGKIVDVVQVSFDQTKLREAPMSLSPPRDYTLADVELNISNYKLLVNGELVAGARRTGGCAGPLVWFHLPGKGRFIFSLTPHEGYDFRKVATIEHNKITFNWDGSQYEWFSDSPIIGSGGNWNLWVTRDAGYIPEFYDSTTPKTTQTTAKSVPLRAEGKDGPTTKAPPNLTFDEEAGRNTKSRKQVLVEREPALSSAAAASQTPRRIRIVIGAADRIENLLPKN